MLCFSAVRLVVISLTDSFRLVDESLFLAKRSKDKVCGRSLVGIAGSNPSFVSIVCCQVEVYVASRSLVQRSSADCGVSLYVI